MARIRSMAPCLWFDDQAEEAAKYYVGIFPNSKVVRTTRYGKEGVEVHGRPAGSVMTVDFELDGHPFTALNGGPHFKFNEAISFQLFVDTQEDLDFFWDRLGAGGDPKAQQCGWVKDRFGLSWQVVPQQFNELIMDGSPAAERAFKAMMGMKKLDLAALQRAWEGK